MKCFENPHYAYTHRYWQAKEIMEMNIEEYYKELENIANTVGEKQIATHEYLESLIDKNDSLINELINFRKDFIDSKEQDEVRGYLAIGFFKQFTGIKRVACFVMTFEIDEIKTKNNWKKRCEPYSKEQPLFQKEPKLFDAIRKKDNGSKDLELIDFRVFNQINDSEILKVNKSYTLIDSALNPQIVSWTKSTFNDRPLYIRANPYKIFDKQPPQLIFEAILMPANPNWWRNLTIHNRAKEGASYILDDCSPKENYRQYWEFHIKNIKRLEVIAKRNNNGNLSMMIEELTGIDNQGLMFGRMIHLDTDSTYGTAFEESKLNHLDLAINVYEGETAKERLEDNLAKGNKSTSASYRTHLLRIENIPFKGLFGYVISFFKSQTLINEWFEDQFR